jgi:hypothetical protein
LPRAVTRSVADESTEVKAAREALRAKVQARAADLAPIIAEVRAASASSLRGIAVALNEPGIPTARGEGQWQPAQVKHILDAARRARQCAAVVGSVSISDLGPED